MADDWICHECGTVNGVIVTRCDCGFVRLVGRPADRANAAPSLHQTVASAQDPLYQEMMRRSRECEAKAPADVTPGELARYLARQLSAKLAKEVKTETKQRDYDKAIDDARRAEWWQMDMETAQRLGIGKYAGKRM